MGIQLDIKSKKPDEGDTKRVRLTPTDDDGTPASLASLSVVFTAPGGTEMEYTLADATQVGDDYLVDHTFTDSGIWQIDVLTTGTQGASERESGTIIVRRKLRE